MAQWCDCLWVSAFVPPGGPIRTTAGGAPGISRHRLAGPGWHRVHRGVRMWHEASLDETTLVRAAALLLPPGAAVAGRSAALLHGVDVRRPDAPVEVVLPREAPFRSRSGIAVRRALLDPGDIVRIDGMPATSGVRTAFDLTRLEGHVEAVVCLDALLHAGVTSAADLEAYVAARPGWRGVRHARRALDRSDGRAESPMESRLRLILSDGGLPPPVVNEPVTDSSGRFLARPDLRIGSVLIEYDGAVHRDAPVFVRDLARQNRLVHEGFVVLRYTAEDVLRRPSVIVTQVRAALPHPPTPRRS